MSTTTTFSGIILLLLCGEVIVPNSSATTQDTLLFQKLQTSQQDETARLAGTWQKEVADARSSATTLLTLRADKTYTKIFRAKVDGANYGGTHDGRWSANGTVVQLSGDGNWPPTREDLREFRKLQ